MTRELFHDGLDSEKEFDMIFDVAQGLWARQRKKRSRCVDELTTIGVKALGPILYMVECDASSDDDDEDAYNNFYEACLEAVKRIGKPALPILEKYIEEDDANIVVNEFAQEAVFEVLGLDEEERKKVCRHRESFGYKEKGKTVFYCAICGKEMEEEEIG